MIRNSRQEGFGGGHVCPCLDMVFTGTVEGSVVCAARTGVTWCILLVVALKAC